MSKTPIRPKRGFGRSLRWSLGLGLAFCLGCPPPVDLSASKITLVDGERKILSHAALAERQQLTFEIALDAELATTRPPQAAKERDLKIVAIDGRTQTDRAIERITEAGAHRLEFTVSSAFMKPGLYLVELEVGGSHPLGLRRFSIEVR